MITAEQACTMFLTMPVVEQGSHHGSPDFRVKDKIFATILPGMHFANLKVGKEEQFMLASQVRVYSIPHGGERAGWISVKLAAVGEEDFLELVWKAWRYTAPARLGLQY